MSKDVWDVKNTDDEASMTETSNSINTNNNNKSISIEGEHNAENPPS